VHKVRDTIVFDSLGDSRRMADVMQTDPHRHAGLRRTFIALALLVVTAAAFSPVCFAEFLNWDDQTTLYQNPDMNPPTLAGIGRYWTEPAGELYIPVTYTVWGAAAHVAYAPDAGAQGIYLNATVFHTLNLAIHLLTVLAAFGLLRLLIGNDIAAAAGAAVLALHPLQVEPVAWVSGTKDVLCGLLSLLAIWQYLRSLRPNIALRRKVLRYILATIVFVLALLSKPSAVTVPLVAAALAIGILRRPWRAVLAATWPWLVLAMPVAILGMRVQPGIISMYDPLALRPLVAGDALAFYLVKLIAPVQLAIDYGHAPDAVLHRTLTLFAWLLPLAVGLLVWRWRRTRYLLTAAMVFLCSLLPVLGFVRFSFQEYSTVADHYVYVAMLGPALLTAWIWSRTPAPLHAAIVAIIAGLSLLSFRQTRFWHDTVTVFRHNLDVNPTSFAAHRVLGFVYATQGRIPQAIQQYGAALQTHPDDPTSHFNLGNIHLLYLNDPAGAAVEYQAAELGRPNDPAVHSNLAQAYKILGKTDLSNREFAAACVETGKQLEAGGQKPAAVAQFTRALQYDPHCQPALDALLRLAPPGAGQ